MKRLNYARFVLLFIMTLGLGACGDDVYYTDDYLRNSDEKLCGKSWVETYITKDGVDLCTHILYFRLDHKGKETYKYQKINQDGSLSDYYKDSGNTFNWKWMDDKMEGLELDFIDTGVISFDNVWVRENYLSGKLDGEEITLKKE